MNEFGEIELVRRKRNNKEEKQEKKKKGFFAVLFNPRKKRRMSLLLIALFVTGILLSGSTYAWFTANYTVSVSEIDVTVAAGSGIQISTNATTWKALVTVDEIQTPEGYTAHVNQMSTGQLDPVSTVKTVTTDRLTMYKGVVETNEAGRYILTTGEALTDTAGAVGSYLAFDLFIRSDYDQATQLYLTGNSGVKANETDTGIQNAARIAFIILGNTSSSSTVSTMQGLTGGTSVYFWEPNYDTHTQTGYNNATGEYGISTDVIGVGSDFNAISYDGVKSQVLESDNVRLGEANASHDTAGSKFETVTIDYSTKAANQTTTSIFTLNPGVTKIRVYMWIEGQDVDCENGASGGGISFNLGFTTVAE